MAQISFYEGIYKRELSVDISGDLHYLNELLVKAGKDKHPSGYSLHLDGSSSSSSPISFISSDKKRSITVNLGNSQQDRAIRQFALQILAKCTQGSKGSEIRPIFPRPAHRREEEIEADGARELAGLTQERDALISKRDALQKDIGLLQAQVQDRQGEIDRLLAEGNALIQERDAEIKKLTALIEEKNARIRQLEDQIRQERANADREEQAAQEAKQRADRLEREKNELQQNITQLSNEVGRLGGLLEGAKLSLSEKERFIQALQQDLVLARQNISALAEQRDRLGQELQEAIASFGAQKHELQERISELERKNEASRGEMDQLRSALESEVASHRQDLEKLEGVTKNAIAVEEERQRLAAELLQRNKKILRLKKELEASGDYVARLEEALEQAEKTLNKSSLFIQEQAAQLNLLIDGAQKSKRENERLRLLLQVTRNKLEKSQLDLGLTQGELHVERQFYEQAEAALFDSEKQIRALEEENSEIDEERGMYQSSLEEQNQAFDLLQETYCAKIAKLKENLQSANAELSAAQGAIANKDSRISELEKALLEAQKTLRLTQAELSGTRLTIRKQASQIQQDQVHLSSSTQYLATARHSLEVSQTTVANLTRQLTDLKSKKEGLEQEFAFQRSELDKKHQQAITRLEESLKQQTEQAQRAASSNASLTKQLAELSKAKKTQAQEFSERISQLTQQLQQQQSQLQEKASLATAKATELDALQRQIEDLKVQLTALFGQLTHNQPLSPDLQGAIQRLDVGDIIRQFSQLLAQQQERIATLEKGLEQLRQQAALQQTTNSSQTEQLSSQQSRIAELETELAEQRKVLSSIEKVIPPQDDSDQRPVDTRLDEILNALRAQLAEAQEAKKISDQEQEKAREEAKIQKAQYDTEILRLQQELANRQAELERIREEAKKAQEEMASSQAEQLAQIQATYDSKVAELEAKQKAEIEKLNIEHDRAIQALQKELVQTREQLKKQQTEAAAVQQKLTAQLEAQKKRADKAQSALSAKAQELFEAQQSFRAQTSLNKEHEEALAVLRTTLDEAQRTLQSKEAEKKSQASSSSETITQLRERIEELRKEIAALNESHKKALADEQAKLKALSAEFEKAKKKNDELVKLLKNIYSQLNGSEAGMPKTIQGLSDQVTQLLSTLKSRAAELQKSLESSVKGGQEKDQANQLQLAALQKELATLRQRLTALEKDILPPAQGDDDSTLETRLQNLLRELAANRETLSSQRRQIEESANALQASEKRNKEAQETIERLTQELAATKDPLTAALARAKEAEKTLAALRSEFDQAQKKFRASEADLIAKHAKKITEFLDEAQKRKGEFQHYLEWQYRELKGLKESAPIPAADASDLSQKVSELLLAQGKHLAQALEAKNSLTDRVSAQDSTIKAQQTELASLHDQNKLLQSQLSQARKTREQQEQEFDTYLLRHYRILTKTRDQDPVQLEPNSSLPQTVTGLLLAQQQELDLLREANGQQSGTISELQRTLEQMEQTDTDIEQDIAELHRAMVNDPVFLQVAQDHLYYFELISDLLKVRQLTYLEKSREVIFDAAPMSLQMHSPKRIQIRTDRLEQLYSKGLDEVRGGTVKLIDRNFNYENIKLLFAESRAKIREFKQQLIEIHGPIEFDDHKSEKKEDQSEKKEDSHKQKGLPDDERRAKYAQLMKNFPLRPIVCRLLTIQNLIDHALDKNKSYQNIFDRERYARPAIDYACAMIEKIIRTKFKNKINDAPPDLAEAYRLLLLKKKVDAAKNSIKITLRKISRDL
jgi:chromosome segregation ATPase